MPAGEVCGPGFLQVSHRVWREGLLKMWDGDDDAFGDDDDGDEYRALGERNDDLTCYCLQHSLIYKLYFQPALLVVGDPRAVIGALVTTELTVTLWLVLAHVLLVIIIFDLVKHSFVDITTIISIRCGVITSRSELGWRQIQVWSLTLRHCHTVGTLGNMDIPLMMMIMMTGICKYHHQNG